MNIFLIIGLFSGGLLASSFLIEGTAQVGGIEGYTEADKDKKFQRLQFEFYVLASDLGDGNNFLNGIEAQRAVKVLKSLPFKSNASLWCNHITFGEIYRIVGAYVFKNDIDANEIKDWLQNNLPINKIRFAEFYLLNNNHHWDLPHPDEVLIHKTYGNEQLFRQVEINCSEL